MKIIGLSNIRYELDNLKEIPHILFVGARGTGKTTLAMYLAQTKHKNIHFLTGNTLKKQDMLATFVTLEKDDIILIDEIHRLRPEVEELLYQPLELFKLPIQDKSGNHLLLDLEKFSLIGTTTKPSKLSKPLLSRFQLTLHIPHYNIRELARIVRTKYNISQREALLVASNTITPREALNLAFRVVQLGGNIQKNLEFIGYKFGLSKTERYYLKIVHKVGKISKRSLASALQIDEDELDYIEDKLIHKGLVEITNRGRSLTIKGMLKIKEMLK